MNDDRKFMAARVSSLRELLERTPADAVIQRAQIEEQLSRLGESPFVPEVGAGFSAASGLPSFSDFLRRLETLEQAVAEIHGSSPRATHRDLKLSNVISTTQSEPKPLVIDFGFEGIGSRISLEELRSFRSRLSQMQSSEPSLNPGSAAAAKAVVDAMDRLLATVEMHRIASKPPAPFEERYATGVTVSGRVSRIVPFGAFVELEPGVEGLIHISELDHKRIRRVEEAVTVGQVVEARVVHFDLASKRIGLSMKALKERPVAESSPTSFERSARIPRARRKHRRSAEG